MQDNIDKIIINDNDDTISNPGRDWLHFTQH